MAYKDIEKLRSYRRKWYSENKKHARDKVKSRQESITKWLYDYKSNLKCSVCGEDDVACLDFHHRNPKDKDIVIAKVAHNGWSVERILKEIAKCDVLCSNCHRKLHYYRSIG